MYDEVLCELVKRVSAPVVIVGGNHDSPERLACSADLLERSNVFVRTASSNSVCPVRVEVGEQILAICPIPYCEPATARLAFNDKSIHSHSDVNYKYAAHYLSKCHNDEMRIAVGHAFVAGGQESDSERPLSVGGGGCVAPEHFSDFDYVALGHLHAPQTVKQSGIGGCINYSGSILKYSSSEISHTKSISVVTIDRDSVPKIERIALSPRRDLKRISGDLQGLLIAEHSDVNDQDYLIVELTDRGPVLNAMQRLRERYPNVLHIERPYLIEQISAFEQRIDAARLDAQSLFSRFCEYVSDDSPSPEELQFFEESWKQASEFERDG